MAKRSSKSNTPKTSGEGGSRSRTRERREERQKQKRQQQQFTIAGVIAIVAVIAVGVFILTTRPATAPIPVGTIERYEGIPQNFSDTGFPLLGRVDAPVRFMEYSSFSCPACAEFHSNSVDMLIEKVREGVISFTYVPLSIGPIPNAEGANRAALCAGEQGAFWEYHDMLFNWQRTYGNRAFSQNRLISGADNLGLNSSQFSSCINSSRISNLISAAESSAREREVVSTPSIFVDGLLFSEVGDITGLEQRIDTALMNSGLSPVPLVPPEVEEEEIEPEETPEVTEEPEETPEVTEEPADEPDDEDVEEEVDDNDDE